MTAAAAAQDTGPVRLPPAEAKSLESWSYALALERRELGQPGGDHARPPLQRRRRPASQGRTQRPLEDGEHLHARALPAGGLCHAERQHGLRLRLPGPGTAADHHDAPRFTRDGTTWSRSSTCGPTPLPTRRGSTRGYQGGTFALVGPSWKGELPSGVRRIDAPTRWVLIQPRVHLKDEADLPGARAVLEGIQVQSLAQYLGRPALAAPRLFLSCARPEGPQPAGQRHGLQGPAPVLGDPVGGHEREPAAAGRGRGTAADVPAAGAGAGQDLGPDQGPPAGPRGDEAGGRGHRPDVEYPPGGASSSTAGSCRRPRWATSARTIASGPSPPGSA